MVRPKHLSSRPKTKLRPFSFFNKFVPRFRIFFIPLGGKKSSRFFSYFLQLWEWKILRTGSKNPFSIPCISITALASSGVKPTIEDTSHRNEKESSWFLFSNGGKKHSNTLSVLLSISGLLENKRLVFGFPFPTPVALRLLRRLSVVGPKLNFPGPLFLHFTHNGTAAKQRPCIWCEEESASEGLEFLLGEFWNGPEQKQQKIKLLHFPPLQNYRGKNPFFLLVKN